MRLFTSMIMAMCLLQPFGRLLVPPPPQPWFIEHFNLKPFELPSGVSTDVTSDNDFEYLVIKNSSATTLYIATTSFTNHHNTEDLQVDFPAPKDPKEGLRYKIVNGQAYHWRNGWREGRLSSIERIDDSLWLHINDDSIRCNDDKVLSLEARNYFSDDRPKDVKIPEPQDVLLPIIYGKEFIYIPLTISYTLNNDYHPASSLNLELLIYLSIPAIFLLPIIALCLLIISNIREWLEKKAM